MMKKPKDKKALPFTQVGGGIVHKETDRTSYWAGSGVGLTELRIGQDYPDARKNDLLYYIGRRCKKCGTTKRYASCRSCVCCGRSRDRLRRGYSESNISHARVDKLALEESIARTLREVWDE